jgi:hypothetical protein
MLINMKNFLVVFALVLVSYSYTCEKGDTLQSIAQKYSDNQHPRAIAELREGIREVNYDQIGWGEVWPKLVIKINKWVPDIRS